MASVFFYVSGHGFGHASRQIEIINALAARAPELGIVVRSPVPEWLFHRTLRGAVRLEPGECDTGVVQIDSLHLDARETIERAAAFHAALASRAEREAALIYQHGGVLVIADAPPLGCAAAAAAGVPSVVVSNFTWDWIYEWYAEELRSHPRLLADVQAAYRLSTAAWRLPMHGGFDTFAPGAIADVPFVARRARHARADVRRAFDLPADRPLVLFSFGGLRVHDLDFAGLDCLDRYGVVLTPHEAARVGGTDRAGIHVISEERLYGSGFRYEDLVAASDVVLTKPGYGIIAECIANGPAILYTPRGRFREYDVLVAAMPRFLRCGPIEHEPLFAGRWRAALDLVLAGAPPPERPSTDGAETIAGMILDFV